MKQDYLEKLEYNKILELLLKYCHTNFGKEFAYNLKPSFKQEKVKLLLDETKEALYLLERKGSIPIFEIDDISISLKISLFKENVPTGFSITINLYGRYSIKIFIAFIVSQIPLGPTIVKSSVLELFPIVDKSPIRPYI